MSRLIWRISGLAFLLIGTIGIVLPLLPTVVFYILAAFCFARSNPAWEARLLAHPRWGPHITGWRERGAIARSGKIMALISLAVSGLIGAWYLDGWIAVLPAAAALSVGSWIATRPG